MPGNRKHIVIRRSEFFSGSEEKPDIGVFTQTHSSRKPIPWDNISAGDEVWMKWSGGPIVARAYVSGYRLFEKCTPERLRETTFGLRLFENENYWGKLPKYFFGMAIYLTNESWLEKPFVPKARSYSLSWIQISEKEEDDWLNGKEEQGALEKLKKTISKRSRTIPLTLRWDILQRDQHTCQYCGRKPPEVVLHLDHIIPFSAGGEHSEENLITSCAECNLGKGAKSYD